MYGSVRCSILYKQKHSDVDFSGKDIELFCSASSLSGTKMDSPTHTHTHTHTHKIKQTPFYHLQCCHKLNSADKRQRLSRRKVELDRVQEVCIVHLDVHKHVQHLNTCCGVYGDCREKEKTKGRQINNSQCYVR